MQAFCGFSAVFLAFIIPRFDRFCTVYRIIEIIQLALIRDWNRFFFAFARLVACLSAQINVAYRELTGVDVIVKAA